MILSRYLNREVVHMILAIMSILLIIVISNMFIRYLSFAANGTIVSGAVWKFIALALPKYISILLPISLFFSILLVYGKLFSTNELTIAFSAGMSWLNLAKITLFPVVIIFFIEIIFTLFLVPYMNANFMIVQKSANNGSVIDFLQTGKIMDFNNGTQVIYVDSKYKNGRLKDVFIYQKNKDNASTTILTAPIASQYSDKNNTYLVLENGNYINLDKNNTEIKKGTFEESKQFLQSNSDNDVNFDLDSISTLDLFKDINNHKMAELQWRISFPLVVLVVFLIGLALCKISPRQGRYGKLIPAILIFVLYFNLMSISKSWIEKGIVPYWIGIWWVHILFGSLSFIWILKLNGSFIKKNKLVDNPIKIKDIKR